MDKRSLRSLDLLLRGKPVNQVLGNTKSIDVSTFATHLPIVENRIWVSLVQSKLPDNVSDPKVVRRLIESSPELAMTERDALTQLLDQYIVWQKAQ